MPHSAFDPATAFFVAGVLYVVMPLAAWFAMGKARTIAADLWCLGSMSLGLASLLLVFRAGWPAWVGYAVINSIFYAGNLLHISALRYEFGQSSGWRVLIGIGAILMGVHEYLRLFVENQSFRFGWVLLSISVLLVWTARLAWHIHNKESRQSARWLAWVYFFGAFALSIRGVRVSLDITAADPISRNWDSVLTFVSLFVMSVFGSVVFLGLYLERSRQRDLELAVELERQKSSQALGEEIAHLDRQRSLGELAAAMAHELSQPLTAVAVELGFLKRQLSNQNTELNSQVDSIDKNIDRATSILKGIRNFIQPTPPAFKPVNLMTVLDEVLNLLPSNLSQKNIQIQCPKDWTLPWVNGDFVQLSQVLLNILRNALQSKFSDQDLNVLISLNQIGPHLSLVVVDDGGGFSEQALKKTGLAFFSEKSNGMGIGLSISQRIVSQHGGSLTFSNRSETRGARVELVLPVFNG